MRAWILSLTLAALTAACGQVETVSTPTNPSADSVSASADAGLSGFSHKAGENLFGYYIPTQDVRVGDLRLDHLHIGGKTEFAAWEAGQRSETYAPVMLEFSDLSSPVETNELGAEVHTVRVRVLPSAYRLGDGDFRFVGEDARVGTVTLDGMLDLGVLGQARSDGPSSGEPEIVLRSAAQFGSERLGALSFFWFGGD